MDPQVFQNPLFVHPSDGPGSLSIQEKLIGAQNYRSWRRSVEIGLSTKRKLGFVTGSVIRSATNAVEAEQWDTCNNMVISWIMNSVSESIVKSIMFVGTASEIWKQLEKRFALSNGSRKYKLYKDMYSSEQLGSTVSEYYTRMKCIWEEIDSMSELPRIENVIPEIVAFLAALNLQKEEQHLFQFMNGLDEHFGALRSQLLLMTPLPNVEMACSMLQQEDKSSSGEKSSDKCAICGHKWHAPDKCWERIGYPAWHYKSKLAAKQSKAKTTFPSKSKKVAANVTQGNNVVFTSEQFEQLLKCLP
ncbi:uncharacterized protein [Rutidosis leptorrhynchoides]|uniref:uncharacterized protein n=1 Tax=Rutidosis leptorrhynchoides TaxID=125765 RepID=UPI003A99D933